MPLKTRRRKYNHNIYKKISHAVRLNCIFDHVIHAKPVHVIVKETGFSYNTVRNIIVGYIESGRTNRKSFTRSTAHNRPSAPASFTSTSSTANTITRNSAVMLLPCLKVRLESTPINCGQIGLPSKSIKLQGSSVPSAKVQPKPRSSLALLPTDWRVNEAFGGRSSGSSSSGESDLKLVRLSPLEQIRDNTADSELVSSNILDFEPESSTISEVFMGPLASWNAALSRPTRKLKQSVQFEQMKALAPPVLQKRSKAV